MVAKSRQQRWLGVRRGRGERPRLIGHRPSAGSLGTLALAAVLVGAWACAGSIEGDEEAERSSASSDLSRGPAAGGATEQAATALPDAPQAPSGAMLAGAAGGAMVAGSPAPLPADTSADLPDPAMPEMVELEEPAAPPCNAVREVFGRRCAGSQGCHLAVGIGNFAAGEEEAASYLGKSPVFNVSSCGLMIDPVRPERSMILTKITGTAPYSDGCNSLMPPPFGGLEESEIECVRSWLEQFRQ